MSRSNKGSNTAKVLVIGLTGSLGSGKSTVAGMFADLGAKVLDADAIARQLMRPGSVCFGRVVKAFGKDVLKAGRIERKRIAEQVFRNPRQRRKLEQIIHPEVRRSLLAKIMEYKRHKRKRIIVLDVPLLFEAKLDRDVDISIVVKACRAKRLARATQLLSITKSEAERRMKAQMPLRKKIRLADMIIDNDGTLNQTIKQVKQIWEKL